MPIEGFPFPPASRPEQPPVGRAPGARRFGACSHRARLERLGKRERVGAVGARLALASACSARRRANAGSRREPGGERGLERAQQDDPVPDLEEAHVSLDGVHRDAQLARHLRVGEDLARAGGEQVLRWGGSVQLSHASDISQVAPGMRLAEVARPGAAPVVGQRGDRGIPAAENVVLGVSEPELRLIVKFLARCRNSRKICNEAA